MGEDITRALIAAMAYSQEPMSLSDPNLPDDPIIAVNAAFLALTGYEEADVVGRNCRFLQGEATDAHTPARIRHALQQRRGCIQWIVNYRRDGSRFWNLLFLSPVFARDGRLLHYFGNQRDITEGPSPDLPDYVLGTADMPACGKRVFDEVLLDVLDAHDTGAAAAGSLSKLVESARRLDEVTVRLTPAAWSMPAVA